MSVSSGPKAVSEGLILSIDAANPKSYSGSGTTVSNMTSLSVGCTLVNGPGFSTDGVGSWTFDGSNDYISIDNSSRQFQWTPSGAGNNTLCFELWIKSSDTGGYYVSKPWNGNGEYNYYMYNTGFQFGNGSGNVARSAASVSTGNWEHVVYVITPTQSAVYRNGLIDPAAGFSNHGLTVNTPTNGDFNNTIPLAIMTLYPYGSWAGNTGFSIQGNVGMLKVYNRLLSAAEILQSYRSTKSRFRV